MSWIDQWTYKWDGQPRDHGRYSFGKQPKLASQPAAMRRGPRVPSGTPAQQARLALANARAEEAVGRVRRFQPNWPGPQSALSRDNPGDVEAMIRAKEAETREAEARYVALARAGHGDTYVWRDAPSTAEVLAPRGEPVGRVWSSDPQVRTVTAAEFENIRAELMGGARRFEPDARYDGVCYRRNDGSEIGLRISREHGLTLDVLRSDHPIVWPGFKVHQP
jgi:hypothetical protein